MVDSSKSSLPEQTSEVTAEDVVVPVTASHDVADEVVPGPVPDTATDAIHADLEADVFVSFYD